ncbi:hypothetical protein BJ912DRAFT_1057278 [Pholiota molesta]|nr:hypothetical protein BJ912DRAFT_1057278 [Pholiota molesta]
MMLATIVVVTSFICTVHALSVPREVQNIDGHVTKISSAVVKAIIIGIILFICAFLMLYAYCTCIVSAHPSPAPSRFIAPPSSFALPVSAVVRFSRSGSPSSSAGEASIFESAVPRAPGKTYIVKTKITSPIAGARAPSVRRMPSC